METLPRLPRQSALPSSDDRSANIFLPCHSPKFWPAVKSTACTFSSTRPSAMANLHVPLLRAVVPTIGSLLLFASHSALGELGAPPATHHTETQASQAQIQPLDKLSWVSARRFWSAWKSSFLIVTLETVVRWHRAGFREYWSLISRGKERVGRKKISLEIRDLIFQMVTDNSTGLRSADIHWLTPRGTTVGSSVVNKEPLAPT